MSYSPPQYDYEYEEYEDQNPNFFTKASSFLVQSLPAIKNGIYNFFYYLTRYWK